MIRSRNSIGRRTSVLLLLLLMLVPVALSGHGHAARRTASDPCAACAVAHHAPVLHAAPLPALAIAFSCLVTLAASVVAPPRNDVAPHAGRAPPSSSPESIA
jgi:hypothetical protein